MEVENALLLSPKANVIEDAELVPPIVTVHVNAVVVPAETVTVFVSSQEESPLTE